MRVARFRFGSDRIGIDFFPVIEVVVQGHGHCIPLADLMVAHGGDSVFIDEAIAAEHAADQFGGVMSPVTQIDT